MFGGCARFSHVGAEECEVAGMARPTPVVDFAAVVADAGRGGVDEPNVAELELFDEVEAQGAVEALELATRAGAILFAARDALFLEPFERALAREIVLRIRESFVRAFRNVGELSRDEHAARGSDRAFVRSGSRREAELQEIFFGG